jgi:hypothetical protein
LGSDRLTQQNDRSSSRSFPYSPLALGCLLFGLGVAIRFVLIAKHPIVYGGDSVMRMMNADRILIAYQLPFLQLLIFWANLLSQDPIILRYLMVLLGGLAGVGFYWLSSLLWGSEAAGFCALFFIFNPFILVHSLVPYQEILMVLMLCLGIALLFEGQSSRKLIPASLCLGLACLTRYEAWIVTAAAAWFHWRQYCTRQGSLFTWKSLWQSVLLFGWAPALWLALHHGLSPSGTFVLEGPDEWRRLYRIPYILMMAAYHAGVPVLLLGAWGGIEFWRKSVWKDRRMQMLGGATLAFLVALIFSAHGVPPDPTHYVTDREAHWLMLPLLWAAGVGAVELKKRLLAGTTIAVGKAWPITFRKAVFAGLMGLCLLWGLLETDRRIAHLTSPANLQLDYAVAQYLDRHLPPGENALILAEIVSAAAIDEYLERARRKGGERAWQAARQVVSAVNTDPFDYSRTVVNSRLGKTRFFHAAQIAGSTEEASVRVLEARKILFAVVFANYTPSSGWEAQLLEFVRQRCHKRADLIRMGQAASVFELPG